MQRTNYLEGIVKESWREELEKLLRFIMSLIDPKTAKVLFLPGPQAHELELYLRLGFSIKNLTGLERDCGRKKLIFKRNPLLNVVQMDSSVFVHTTKEQFDVISLDTENMFNKKQEETINSIFKNRLIKPHGIVILNYFEGHTNKREKEFLFSAVKNCTNLFEARRLAPINALRRAIVRHKMSFEIQCIAYKSPSPMFTVAAWYSKKAVLKSSIDLFTDTLFLGSEKNFDEVRKFGIKNPAALRKISQKFGADADCLLHAIANGWNFDFKNKLLV